MKVYFESEEGKKMIDLDITAKSLFNIANNISNIIDNHKNDPDVLELKILAQLASLYGIADMLSD